MAQRVGIQQVWSGAPYAVSGVLVCSTLQGVLVATSKPGVLEMHALFTKVHSWGIVQFVPQETLHDSRQPRRHTLAASH